MELTAGLFYGYVVVDVPGLVSNLEGLRRRSIGRTADKSLAAKVVEHLIHLIATVSPGAKLGSTAPYGRARFMLVEAGSDQPYSLADAFRAPVNPPRMRDRTLKALESEEIRTPGQRPTACRERGGLCQWTTAKFHRPSV